MKKKLTLNIDGFAIERGKNYAKKNNRSLSSMVESFLLFLEPQTDDIKEQISISNELKSLVGIAEGPVTEEDYKQHLVELDDKYGADFVDSLVVPKTTRFDSMSDSEIKIEHLRSRGLI